MKAQILCRARPGLYRKIDVPASGETVLGRDPALPAAIPADGVSPRHARIVADGGEYWIEDLKSTEGTFVNGLGVLASVRERLRHLDVIGLGRAVEMLFLVRGRTSENVTRKGILRAALISPEGEDPYELPVGESALGRSSVNNVVVDASKVSKLHARIKRGTEQIVIDDLGSRNGTFVNGARVMTAVLQDGDELSLAKAASYRVLVEWGDVTAPPTAVFTMTPRLAAALESADLSTDWKMRYEGDDAIVAQMRAARKPQVQQVRIAGEGTEVVIDAPGAYEIGRAENARVRLSHLSVSGRHARLVLDDAREGVTIEHLGTRNPTLVNGKPVTTPTALADRDALIVGEVPLTVRIKR